MMNEERITFKTACLAKEKGFGNQVREDGTDKPFFPKRVPYEQCFNVNTGKLITPKTYNPKNPHALAPTQTVLQKWLREAHKIYVLVDMGTYRDYHWKYFDDKNPFTYSKGTFESYEKALEAGLYQALKLL